MLFNFHNEFRNTAVIILLNKNTDTNAFFISTHENIILFDEVNIKLKLIFWYSRLDDEYCSECNNNHPFHRIQDLNADSPSFNILFSSLLIRYHEINRNNNVREDLNILFVWETSFTLHNFTNITENCIVLHIISA